MKKRPGEKRSDETQETHEMAMGMAQIHKSVTNIGHKEGRGGGNSLPVPSLLCARCHGE